MDEVTSKLIFRLKLFYLFENAFQATMRFKLTIDFVDYYFSSIHTSRYSHRISVLFLEKIVVFLEPFYAQIILFIVFLLRVFQLQQYFRSSQKDAFFRMDFFSHSNHKRTVHKQLRLAEFLVDCKDAFSSTEKPANISIPRCIWLESIVIFSNKMMQFSAKLK